MFLCDFFELHTVALNSNWKRYSLSTSYSKCNLIEGNIWVTRHLDPLAVLEVDKLHPVSSVHCLEEARGQGCQLGTTRHVTAVILGDPGTCEDTCIARPGGGAS